MLITYQSKLLDKMQLAPEIFELTFTYPAQENWKFQAGQYMIFHIPQQKNEHSARRLYSIASPPYDTDTLKFVIEMVPNGVGSTHLHQMEIGDEIQLQGPAGVFTFKPSERDVVFLATGTGIAPIYSMLSNQLRNFQQLTTNYHLFWGLKYCEDRYYVDKFKTLLELNNKFKFSMCISRDNELEKHLGEDTIFAQEGRVTVGLEQLLSSKKLQHTSFDYYLCGGPIVVESIREYLAEKGVPKEQVYFEKFTGL